MNFRTVLAAVLSSVLAAPVLAQALPDPAEGYLCCNMRTDGRWISDINYAEAGKKLLPAGTKLKATGYGRYRVYIEVEGAGKQALGNDYSRDIDMTTFAQRYIVAADPSKKLASFPPKIRKAIEGSLLLPGMTREQVLMSVGYPVSSENPRLDARIWRYWISSFQEFQVVFDANDRVKEITTDPQTRNLVVME